MISNEERSILLDEEVGKYVARGYSIKKQSTFDAQLSKGFIRTKLAIGIFILTWIVGCFLGALGIEFPPAALTVLCIAILISLGLAALKMEISLAVDPAGKVSKSQKLNWG